MKNLLTILALATLFFSSFSCEIFRTIDDIDNYAIDTLTHSAFDFSEGNIPSSADFHLSDGETIGWCPDYQNPNPNYPNNDVWIWWRTSESNELQKDYGIMNLDDITKAPSTWNSIINPLIEGHCYVVKCKDGYTKFKVTSVGFYDWDVAIKFEFSDTKDFDSL